MMRSFPHTPDGLPPRPSNSNTPKSPRRVFLLGFATGAFSVGAPLSVFFYVMMMAVDPLQLVMHTPTLVVVSMCMLLVSAVLGFLSYLMFGD